MEERPVWGGSMGKKDRGRQYGEVRGLGGCSMERSRGGSNLRSKGRGGSSWFPRLGVAILGVLGVGREKLVAVSGEEGSHRFLRPIGVRGWSPRWLLAGAGFIVT